MVCKWANVKKQGIQMMILFIVELFVIVKRFGFYIKLSSGQLRCDFIFSELYLISFFKVWWYIFLTVLNFTF